MALCFQYLDETHVPYSWQYLESQDPILTNVQREAPAGEQNFAFSGAKKVEILEKPRAARAREATQTTESRGFCS